MNYDYLLNLLPPLAVSWMGTAADENSATTSIVSVLLMGTYVWVKCCNMVVVVPCVVLGASAVLETCAGVRFGIVGHNYLDPVGFDAHHFC